MPAITGIRTMRLATSQIRAGRPTMVKTTTAIRITMSRKLVPQRGWRGLYFWISSIVSGSPAS